MLAAINNHHHHRNNNMSTQGCLKEEVYKRTTCRLKRLCRGMIVTMTFCAGRRLMSNEIFFSASASQRQLLLPEWEVKLEQGRGPELSTWM